MVQKMWEMTPKYSNLTFEMLGVYYGSLYSKKHII